MTRPLSTLKSILAQLPGAAALVLALSVPVLALPTIDGGSQRTIEAPAPSQHGVGFVLLVSLQR